MKDQAKAIERIPYAPDEDGWEKYADDGFIGLVGPLWQRTENGVIRYALLTEHKHHNRRGFVQGGVLATLADRAMGMTAWHSNNQASQTTIKLELQYVAAAKIGDFVEVRCKVDRVTRSLIFMRADLLVADHLVATADGIWKVLEPRSQHTESGQEDGHE